MPILRYLPLNSHDDESESSDAQHEPTSKRPQSQQRRRSDAVPWKVSTLICLIICTVLTIELWRLDRHALGTYESRYITDVAIPLEVRRFTGTPKFEPDGSTWRTFDASASWPENVSYVGTPNQAIDDAWADLIECRYVSLAETEAEAAWGPDYREYHDEGLGGYTAGLDMFHTLHCVNALRKTLYPDHYPETRLHGMSHLEHCIDLLRQEVQCYGSTTLIPSRFYPAIEQNYIDSDQKHVCRSFTALREWTDRRRTGGDLHVERARGDIDTETYQRALQYNTDRSGKLCS